MDNTYDETFEILALKTMGASAKPDDLAQIRELLKADAGAVSRYAQLRREVETLEDLAVLASNFAPVPANDPIVAAAVEATAARRGVPVRRHLFRWFPVAAAAALIIAVSALLWPKNEELSLADLRPGAETLAQELAGEPRDGDLWLAMNGDFAALAQLAPGGLSPLTKGQNGSSGTPLELLSPDGATRSLRPTIIWYPATGSGYDITVENGDGRTLLSANNVSPPLRFDRLQPVPPGDIDQLAPDSVYSIKLTETATGQSTTALVATTVDAADPATSSACNPAAVVRRCLTELTTFDPPSFGDVLARLEALPADAQMEEPVVRLKLFCLAQRGRAAAFEHLYRAHAKAQP